MSPNTLMNPKTLDKEIRHSKEVYIKCSEARLDVDYDRIVLHEIGAEKYDDQSNETITLTRTQTEEIMRMAETCHYHTQERLRTSQYHLKLLEDLHSSWLWKIASKLHIARLFLQKK